MALTSTQETILKELAKSTLRDRFYWSGGTLLAEKYLQHRYSFDVDLFTDQPFKYSDVYPMIESVKKADDLTVVEEKKVFDRWEFFIHNHNEVRCEFVHYDFKPLKPRKLWRGVMVDSLDDLAANKIMAAMDRREPKDVVDIYFLMTKKKMKLTKLLSLAGRKFGLKVSEATLIGQLLVTCQLLASVKPLLFGTLAEQARLVEVIERFFKNLSVNFVKKQLLE